MQARSGIPTDRTFSHTEKTFFELASEQRLSIIFKLSQKNAKLSQLAKELDITMQEAHRNVNRLQTAGLIEKDSEGVFNLTTFGNTIIKQIPTFDYLSQHKEYFSEHTLGELPMKFIQRIGALNDSEFVKGIVAILERWKKMYSDSEEYVYEMIPQIPLDLIAPVVSRVKEKRIKLSYVFPRNVIVPRGRKELLRKLGFSELLNSGLVERRMVDNVQVAVVINEKQASVLFPTQKGETDMNLMFYSENPLFHEWALDYFRYRWYGSDPFDESKLKEI